MKSIIKGEPVAAVAALSAFGGAVLSLLAFLYHWSDELVKLVTPTWSTFIALVLAVLVRPEVTPRANLQQTIHDAIVELQQLNPPKQ